VDFKEKIVTQFLPEELDRYIYWQEERERIRVNKEVHKKPPPWTDDPILQEFKFCQVFREDDRTTRWFAKHIREPLKDQDEVFMATVIFRWFNLIETGRTLIKENLLLDWDRKKAIREITKQPKWITGAYIIKTPNRMDKVTGVSECVSHMWRDRKHIVSEIKKNRSLEKSWELILTYPYMGPFMAYEVVTDLRWTALLNRADDILTWANAGPGAMRGLNRLTGRDLGYARRSHDWNKEMNDLYQAVDSHKLWFKDLHRLYEMREIEGGLCEFDKYSRIVKGEGRTRSVYKHDPELPIIEEI